ncbi:DoxX family protein [Streptomyces sp. ADMS]|uniref:DoxX family protein n=1 Tax=Streptomyces sp. ADMS TaxID=3071415 RepID=UPI00296EFDD8|nr:DoxX family protein [Streptomyces sp. ADMS]MDW4904865.1 DoxX family protein [Streptomyces sp. ADMS]
MTHSTRKDTHSPYLDGDRDWRDTATRYALLPLRVFLGVTFIYAGLDKLTDSSFFADSGSGSVGDLMRAVRDSSAIPALVDLALKNPAGFGYALAFGELAVGIGTLLGLLARLAAVGGALISLSLWLTVSWASDPYYYGNDLPYLFCWVPLMLAGASVWSVDAWIRGRRRGRGQARAWR